ncbi:MAG TPA: hypothetical protein VH542_12670, partial [Steroidobacteraceae bacterium]
MNSVRVPAAGRFAPVAADLAAQGWSTCVDFAPPGLTARLRHEAQRLSARGAFQPAATGSGAKRSVSP